MNQPFNLRMLKRRRLLAKHKELAKKRRLEPKTADVVMQEDDSSGNECEDQIEDSWESEDEHKSSDEDVDMEENFANLNIVETGDGKLRVERDPNFVEVEEKKREKTEVWKGDPKRLKPDEELVFDNEAYEIFYRTNVEWPCLSLDLIHGPDTGLDPPYSINCVAGSQSSTGKNCIYYLQFTEMYKTQHDD